MSYLTITKASIFKFDVFLHVSNQIQILIYRCFILFTVCRNDKAWIRKSNLKILKKGTRNMVSILVNNDNP